MKITYIISMLLYRVCVVVTIFAIVLGVILIPMAADPMPVLKALSITTIVGGILSFVFKAIVKRAKQSILDSVKNA